MVPIDRAVAAARELERLGYFGRVREGSQRAASLFARLVAYTLNPGGDPTGWGCLSKTPGEQNIDGYAEDAIVYGNDPNNRENVVDLIVSAGAPGARIGGDVKERREHNRWVKPQRLSLEQMRYLNPSHDAVEDELQPQPQPPKPQPQPQPSVDLGALAKRIDALADQSNANAAALVNLIALVVDVRRALDNGLAVSVSGRLPILGSVKLSGVARG